MLAVAFSGDHSSSPRASHPATALSYEVLLSSITAESVYGLLVPRITSQSQFGSHEDSAQLTLEVIVHEDSEIRIDTLRRRRRNGHRSQESNGSQEAMESHVAISTGPATRCAHSGLPQHWAPISTLRVLYDLILGGEY